MLVPYGSVEQRRSSLSLYTIAIRTSRYMPFSSSERLRNIGTVTHSMRRTPGTEADLRFAKRLLHLRFKFVLLGRSRLLLVRVFITLGQVIEMMFTCMSGLYTQTRHVNVERIAEFVSIAVRRIRSVFELCVPLGL